MNVRDGSQTATRGTDRRQGQFVANLSHELRTPIAGILSAVETLRSDVAVDPAVRDRFLEHVDRSTRRLADLCDGLAALAAGESGELLQVRDVPVRATLESVAAELRLVDGVTIAVDVPADLTVRTDPRLFDLAVRNLAGNAAKFTTNGSIGLDGHDADGAVTIEVRDTGCGMTPAEVRHGPDRFWRAGSAVSTPGSGLGLANVEQVCDALGARLDLESSPGRGTVARLAFPHGPR